MLFILTDSCADLSQQLLSAHQVEAIPLHVLVNGKDHLDNELTLDQLFTSVDQTGELPKTAAPSGSMRQIHQFQDQYKQYNAKLIELSKQLAVLQGNNQSN